MNLALVKKSIQGEVTKSVEKFGFKFNTKKKRWERQTLQTLEVFNLLFYAYSTEIRITPVFYLKIFLIDDIFRKAAVLSDEYDDRFPTLGNSLGQIMKFFDHGDKIGNTDNISYSIEDEKDLEILKEVIPKRFKEYILPYFDKYSSIEKVDELLNEKPREFSIHNYIYPIRACIGLIAARLVNNPRYLELKRIYGEEIADANPINRREFEEISKILDGPEYN